MQYLESRIHRLSWVTLNGVEGLKEQRNIKKTVLTKILKIAWIKLSSIKTEYSLNYVWYMQFILGDIYEGRVKEHYS